MVAGAYAAGTTEAAGTVSATGGAAASFARMTTLRVLGAVETAPTRL
jgi:hypothetical protein